MWWTHWTVSYVEASGTGNVQAVALTTHNVKWERTHSNHTGMSEEQLLLLESRRWHSTLVPTPCLYTLFKFLFCTIYNIADMRHIQNKKNFIRTGQKDSSQKCLLNIIWSLLNTVLCCMLFEYEIHKNISSQPGGGRWSGSGLNKRYS